MKAALPETKGDRADRLVAGAYALWIVGGLVHTLMLLPSVAHPVRSSGPSSMAPASTISVLVLLVVMLILEANACLGVFWGRPWGFRWMAALNALSAASPFLAPLRPHSTAPPYPTTPLGIFSVLLSATILVYCLVRLARREPRAEP